MKKNNVEKQLKKAVRQTKMKDFSQVWQEIEGEIEPAVAVPKKRPRKWIYSLASLATCVILFCSIGLPLILKNRPSDMVFFADELVYEDANKIDFFEKIGEANISIIELGSFSGEGYRLLKTNKNKVKGGTFMFFDNGSSPRFWVELKFTTTDVKEKEEIEYNENYSTNGVDVQYKYLDNLNSTWHYTAKATYNSVIYYFEISALTQDVTPFFNEFFDTNS